MITVVALFGGERGCGLQHCSEWNELALGSFLVPENDDDLFLHAVPSIMQNDCLLCFSCSTALPDIPKLHTVLQSLK